MKTILSQRTLTIGLGALPLVMGLALARSGSAAELGQSFATPDQAVASLSAAVRAEDMDAVRAIFGPATAEIANPDRVQATNEFRTFAAALDQGFLVVPASDGSRVLEVGTNSWPFPIPLVQRQGRWFFDTVAGKEELANRRVGKNELEALEVMRAYVDAQREYASADRDGDQVLEYAQRLASLPGRKDGLYWPPNLDGEISPLGPFVAEAQSEGYFADKPIGSSGPQPFHGYLFKILTRQGKHAPGGKYNYVINGHMIGGFALVAWPAEHGASGVMTFLVNQQGRVYQKDLGSNTGKLVARMHAYDPDSNWLPSPD